MRVSAAEGCMLVSRLGFGLVLALASVSCSTPARAPAGTPPAPVIDAPPIAERPVRVAPPPPTVSRTAPAKKSGARAATLDAAIEEYAVAERQRIAAGERVVELVDLNGDGGKDALVLLRSKRHCSSRGCTVLVFQQVRGGYELHSRFLLGRTPMVATNRRTGGWRDLAAPMTSARTGMRLVMLRHGADGYPANAEHLAAVPPTQRISGQVLFSDD